MTELEQAAKDLAGAFWRLDKYGYINVIGIEDVEKRDEGVHYRDIARQAAEKIRELLKK